MEKVLHYLWQYRLYGAEPLVTTCGKKLRVLNPGLLNSDAGADFFNAKIEIDGALWAGNVEIHRCSSDWEKHRHHHDGAYNAVILHVVGRADRDVFNQRGDRLIQLELSCPELLVQDVEFFLHPNSIMPCAARLSEITDVELLFFKNRLLTERLESKSSDVETLLELCRGSWEEVFYIRFLRALGMGINGDAFERLARLTPFRLIQKHASSLFQLEALLLGQAGLLEEDGSNEPYVKSLRNEYNYLRRKLEVTPMESSLWKLMRLRPAAFPHLRLAQVAAVYHRSQSLFAQVRELKSEQQLVDLFCVAPSDYWKEHFCFSGEQVKHTGMVGRTALDVIVINAIVPVVFSYGRKICDPMLCDYATCWLESLPAENNRYTRQWQELGLEIKSATDSQALLQLKREYCEKRKCLFCRIGHKLLAARVK